MHAPEISVCIPVIGEEPSLSQCVQAVLNQSFKDFELLLVLDEHNEQINEIKQLGDLDCRVRIVTTVPIKTRAAALNACIAQARGEYVKFVWPSDLLHPQCLERFIQVFKLHRALSLASCAYDLQLSEGTTAGLWRNKYAGEVVSGRALVKTHLWVASDFVGNLSATFFRRDFGVSGIDERYFNLGELDFWFRLAAQGDYLFIDKSLCTVRLNQEPAHENLSRESMLGCHDYILLADNFSSFMASEEVEMCAFIDANRAAMQSEFRRIFGQQDISLVGLKRIAESLVRSQIDFAERSFAVECYIRLCYELLLCYGNVRDAVMGYRELLDKKDGELAKKDRELAEKDLKLAEKDRQLTEKEYEHIAKVTALEKSRADELVKWQERYMELCGERQRVLSSLSWRFTEPIRLLYAGMRKAYKKSRIVS